jgi:FixJ family two-component response regulator
LSTFLVAVVEDDESVRESLEGLLQSVGYDVLVYDSGEGLLSAGRLDDVDCLITDYGLPGMNGIELLQAAHDSRAELPVIVITARTEPAILSQALAAGARHAFSKPIESAKLLLAVSGAA